MFITFTFPYDKNIKSIVYIFSFFRGLSNISVMHIHPRIKIPRKIGVKIKKKENEVVKYFPEKSIK